MKKKILIGEDERPIARALELKLISSGFDVEVANNGNEVIKAVKSSKFNLIFLDLVMPEKDGFEVLSDLKKMKNKTPVIVLSNLSQEEDERRVLKLGAKKFFIKSNTELSKIVEEVKKILK